MRLIDAEEAVKAVHDEFDECLVWDESGETTANEFENIILQIPTVDPVKHGHWTSSQGLAEVGEVQCSNCKTIYYADDLYNVGETDENGIGQALMPNYCPHCGAYMGVEDGKI